MTKSPWAGLDPATPSAEEIETREGCVDIITRLSELLHFIKSDGVVDDIQAMKLSLLLSCFIAFANRKSVATDSDLKSALQLMFDDAFHVARNIVISTKELPPL